MPDESTPHVCPVCQKPLAENSVLCVACGYHLQLGYHLSTLIEPAQEQPTAPAITPVSDNPYAPPQLEERAKKPRMLTPEFDLTESGASWARAVIADADMSLALSILCCLCGPLWLLMFPWYVFRVICWHSLNSTYAELRYPNSFSPHGNLPVRFQESRYPLYRGAVVGFIAWIVVTIWGLSR